MTTFVYHYIDSSGRGRVHWQQAESAADCCALLAECGIYPIRLFGLQRPAAFSARGLSKRQLAVFLRQLAMAQSSGVQLSEALAHMHRGQMSERQRAFVSRIESGMHAGLAFSEALRREKSVPLLLCQWIAIGERQGQLAQVLQEICRHLENQERLKKRIQQQLLYPMIVLVTLLLVGLVLSFVVLPVLVRQFMDFNTEVPMLMRFILLVHDGLAQYGGWLLLAFAAGIVLLLGRTGNKQEHASGRGILRALVLRVPLLRKYFVLQIYVPFARLFGQMLQSSVPVGDALEEMERYFSRTVFAADVAAVRENMAQGAELSQVLADAVFVPEPARLMLLSGERYGQLSQTLTDSAEYCETILFEELSMWIRLVEPVAIMLLGVFVLFVALGLFLPVLGSYQALLSQ